MGYNYLFYVQVLEISYATIKHLIFLLKGDAFRQSFSSSCSNSLGFFTGHSWSLSIPLSVSTERFEKLYSQICKFHAFKEHTVLSDYSDGP